MRQPLSYGRSLAALALAVLVSGCAARNAYRHGQNEAKNGNWDMAVAKLTVALQESPDNIGYKIALENAKVQASRMHYAEARKAMAADELDHAAEELDVASKYDSANKSAADDLVIVQEKIRKREDQKKRLADFEKMKDQAPNRVPVPTLSARSPVPITLRFGSGTKLQKVLDTLGKLAGVNILYDESFRDKDYEVNLTRRHLRGSARPDHLHEPPLLQGAEPEHPHDRARVAPEAAHLRRLGPPHLLPPKRRHQRDPERGEGPDRHHEGGRGTRPSARSRCSRLRTRSPWPSA